MIVDANLLLYAVDEDSAHNAAAADHVRRPNAKSRMRS